VKERIEQQRDAQEHYEQSDPYNLDVFYGDEFGNAFDDVANKFNEQRQYGEGDFDSPDVVGGERDENHDLPEPEGSEPDGKYESEAEENFE